jgi:hypothetical protein
MQMQSLLRGAAVTLPLGGAVYLLLMTTSDPARWRRPIYVVAALLLIFWLSSVVTVLRETVAFACSHPIGGKQGALACPGAASQLLCNIRRRCADTSGHPPG